MSRANVEVGIETVDVATPEVETPALPGPDINAFDLLVAVAKHKKQICWASVSAGLLVLLLSLLLSDMYTATTRILPPQQTQSMAAAMLGQLGPLASLAGHDLGLKNPNDIYIAMLESRIAGDALIRRFDLMRRYRSRSFGKAREELAKRTAVISGKDGIISILYEDEDPRRAADISNAYVEELSKISRTLAITEAAQRRLFYENQLRLAKEQLGDAETALRVTQESTGLIEPGAQAKAIIESVAGLRAQIALKEVQLKAMSVFATDENPDYVRTQREIAGLHGQLSQLERDTGAQRKGDVQVATEKVPEAGMEYLRGYRDVKYHETIFELIAKQYEMAKMDEGRDAAVIQVLDPAIPPEKRSRPERLSMVLMGVFGTALTAMLVAIFRELPLLSPEQQAKWRLTKSYLAAR
ncbi:MAG TPA: Wzz/FepE/Etk N-terminal domain-containing protein [Terriglobales bacterium]|nr:Wzz/FepE/Etk N-terminal domain-containing protein [Terriglobales bacterium]